MADDLMGLAARLNRAGPEVVAQTRAAVRKTAFDIVAHAQQHVPVDTGATKNSIGASFAGSNAYVVQAEVGPTTHYAPYLEHGTARMAPRPFMGPAAEANVPGLEEALRQIGGDIL